MIEGTEREVLELLLERPRSPTAVAEELGVSVQTASRNLKRLADRRFAEQVRGGEGRGYKRYRVREFARVFAGYGGELLDQTIELTETHRMMLSILQVPQSEFHPILLSRLSFQDDVELSVHAEVVVLYGSVARGEASGESDIDLLIIYDPEFVSDGEKHQVTVESPKASSWWGGPLASETEHIVSEEWFSIEEFNGALDVGSQFLRNVLDEGIVLYDPEGVIRDARQKRAGESVPQ